MEVAGARLRELVCIRRMRPAASSVLFRLFSARLCVIVSDILVQVLSPTPDVRSQRGMLRYVSTNASKDKRSSRDHASNKCRYRSIPGIDAPV